MTGTAEQEQNEITTTEAEKVEPIAIYNNQIYALVDDLKNDSQFIGLTDEELKNNKAFFPRLTQYIYNNYLGDLLDNKLGKQHKTIYPDIHILDNLFNIYIDLVSKYKWNNRPSILEYCILTGISRETVYKWINGDIDNNLVNGCIDNNAQQDKRKHITYEYVDAARKWQAICEQALVDGNGEIVKEIFLLKAKHGYRDNNNEVNITVNHKQIISADALPSLIQTQ